MICYTTIFGDYDDLKDPLIITPGWKYICFTDQPLKSNVWEIVRVDLVDTERLTAKYYKILFHRVIDDDISLYIDGSFYVNCNLNEWMERFRPPFTALQHHLRNCVYEEAKACIINKRDNENVIVAQIEYYRMVGVPENNGMAETGIMMRQRTPETVDFMERWFAEVSCGSGRDQIAFGYIDWQTPLAHRTEYNYFKGRDFLHVPHLHAPERRRKRLAHYRLKGFL